MTDIWNWLSREAVYLWYYLSIQIEQIAPYWLIGIIIGSAVSVFGRRYIHGAFEKLGKRKMGVLGVIPASLLGIASPLCMYGTIPIAASFSEKGVKDDYLAAFMMSSVLLNPQLMMYSAALGQTAMLIRFISCFLCGCVAGVLVRVFYHDKGFFNFKGFQEGKSRDTDPNILLRFLKNIWRNIKATGPMFLLGILLTALYQIHVPSDAAANLFGGKNSGFGVLMAATIGVPLYMCGGGTIPLLQQWLLDGMSMGSATAFMITGPATKLTNLGAMKIVLGAKRFILYLAFVMLFALVSGLAVDLLI
ncbi:MAG: permease [Eubacteriales bacterium]|nr:permease [Eubacteriales bacterium]MDD3880790.1 permease [Eubacteriales bacterium]MDD4511843.1 permease [Eubacteriales bacterium]